MLLEWPKAHGGWCRIARSRSSSASPRTGAAPLGRDEPAVRAARPPALKARMPLRTVCVAQRRSRAIARGRRPSALASTTCARRTVKALGARRPASSRARSAALGSRTKMGGCIPARCDLGRLAQALLWACTRRGRRHRPDRGSGADRQRDGRRLPGRAAAGPGGWRVVSLIGDGAYDRGDVYGAVAERHPEAAVVVPPRRDAVPSATAEIAPTRRYRHLRSIAERGRTGWQKV